MIEYLQSKKELQKQKIISIYLIAIKKAHSEKERDYLIKELNYKALTF